MIEDDITPPPEGIIEQIDNAMYQLSNHSFTDRTRPYDGQPHTDQGARGATLVEGLTFRDVCDCFIAGWLHAAGATAIAESPDATYNDVFDYGNVDPLAVMQCMSVEMEKRMGIYPNVPPLNYTGT